jgi:4-amino-4-deoxy-L-arabinose transferase-like glycosyltransferase
MFIGHSAPNKREEKGLHRSLHLLGLGAILALSAFSNLSWLAREEHANVYYAATVKNMLISWHNFFFASYDAGFVSVDKPPLGFWIQAASASVFGFHPWSLLLPQALAGILCVALLYHLVGRSFGPVAGLLAAISFGVLSLLLAPSIWAVSTVWYGAETRSPTAGPQAKPSETSNRFGSEGSEVDPLVDYLEANQGDAEYLVAAIRSRIASPIILNTDEPVISLGGFNGADPVFSNERLAALVKEGAVRYFLIEGRDRDEKSVRWITENCEQVRQQIGQSSDSTVLLYACSATALVESGNPSSEST